MRINKTSPLLQRKLIMITGCLLLSIHVMAQEPVFNPGQDPKPSGKKWQAVKKLSDEFDGSSLNTAKWQNTDPRGWKGRAPGLFTKEAVSVSDGNLMITSKKLDAPQTVNGAEFTHQGGMLTSMNPAFPGYYFECRMKANKTFMSSTFWLINKKNEGKECDKRITELDIQECVGFINSTAKWTQNFDESMHSNTHSRGTVCDDTPVGKSGNNEATSGKVYDDYHVYGAWWKNKNEIQFYLDGDLQYTVKPPADFDLKMYLKMVVETYNWNPVPDDGGMTGTFTERTTFYDWVRTWELAGEAKKG
ncbi:MAG: glycoside hydrolase [Bacteroidota bacterium]